MMHTVTAVMVVMVTKYGRLDETWLLVSNFAWLLGYHYFRETNVTTLIHVPVQFKPIYHKSPFFQCFGNMARS
jgi:hypothetical protein